MRFRKESQPFIVSLERLSLENWSAVPTETYPGLGYIDLEALGRYPQRIAAYEVQLVHILEHLHGIEPLRHLLADTR